MTAPFWIRTVPFAETYTMLYGPVLGADIFSTLPGFSNSTKQATTYQQTARGSSGRNRLVSTCYTSCTMLVVTNMTGQVSSMSVIRGTNDLCVS